MMDQQVKKQEQTSEANKKENESTEKTVEIDSNDSDLTNNVSQDQTSEELEVEEVPKTADSDNEKAAKKTEEEQNYIEQFQRLHAEFQNYKRRAERERQELGKFIKAEFIRTLLPIIDDFDRFIENHQESDVMEGFQLIHDKMMNVLKEAGLEQIKAIGEPFDPNFHDALYVQAVENEEDDSRVLEEWEKGFLFQGMLLRPAKVKVGKKKSDE